MKRKPWAKRHSIAGLNAWRYSEDSVGPAQLFQSFVHCGMNRSHNVAVNKVPSPLAAVLGASPSNAENRQWLCVRRGKRELQEPVVLPRGLFERRLGARVRKGPNPIVNAAA